MRITQIYKPTSDTAKQMFHDAITQAHNDIYDKYQKPSRNKVISFNALKNDYMHNDSEYNGVHCKTVMTPQGIKHMIYRGDIGVVNASCHFYTTIATFNDCDNDNGVWVIKETYQNTYAAWMQF